MVAFQVGPEQPDQIAGELGQGDIVHGRLAFPQVIHQMRWRRTVVSQADTLNFIAGGLTGLSFLAAVIAVLIMPVRSSGFMRTGIKALLADAPAIYAFVGFYTRRTSVPEDQAGAPTSTRTTSRCCSSR